MLRHVVGIAVLLGLTLAAQAQQSWRERCRNLPERGPPGIAEFCRGINAATGSDGLYKPDEEAALHHYQRAAELGFAEAQATLGAIYERGWHVPKDPAAAAGWYAKAAAQGHAGAELNLGNLYAKGEGVPRDLAKARTLMQAAAAQGMVQAKRALAELEGQGASAAPGAALFAEATARYRAGDHPGAAKLVQQAAEAGNPTATYEMGYLYENGDGLPQNMAEAARWFRKGAAMGEPRSESALGQLYEQGQQVPNDWVAAAGWYIKGAKQDDPASEFRLGRAYQYGIGVPLDLSAAVEWYDKAAAQGEGQAAYFAKYIRENHGFDGSSYNDQEAAIMAPYRGHPWSLRPPPAGRVFHNTQERLGYFVAWVRNGQAYENCVSAHRLAGAGAVYTCPAPVPPN